MKYKFCNLCKTKKELGHFYNKKESLDGKSSNCKKCQNEINKTYLESHKDTIKIYSKKYHQTIRNSVIHKYGNLCSCCGETQIEFLSIDHINKDGAKKRKLGMKGSIFYRWLLNNPIQPDLRILCHNCNMSFGMYGYCPHYSGMDATNKHPQITQQEKNKMDVLVLFWISADNFVGIIPNPMTGDNAKNEAIRQWESDHDYNPNTIMAIEYYIEK